MVILSTESKRHGSCPTSLRAGWHYGLDILYYHRLICLNTWFSIDDTIGGVGG